MDLKTKMAAWIIEGAIRKDGIRRRIVEQAVAWKIISWIKEADKMENKPWYASKTLWWNAISLVTIIAGVLADPSAAANPRVQIAAASIVTIGNKILRFFTEKPIGGNPQ